MVARLSWVRLPVVAVCAGMFGGCSADESLPPLTPPDVGTVVGEVMADESGTLTSIGGALVEVYGTSVRARTVAGEKFVLSPVPMGSHDVVITDTIGGRSGRTSVSVTAPFQTVELDPTTTTLSAPATLQGILNAGGAPAIGGKVYVVGGTVAQLTFAGPMGDYTLANLPTGDIEIGFAHAGHETQHQTLTIAAGANMAMPVDLAAAAGSATVSGTILAADRTNHQGTTVLLDGVLVSPTDANGAFSFAGVAPGVHALKATRSGYKSIKLPSISVFSNGTVAGLPAVLFMSPGQDSEESSVDAANITVQIARPAVAGAPIYDSISTNLTSEVLGAAVGFPDNAFVWSYRFGSGPYTQIPVRGRDIQTIFPSQTMGATDCADSFTDAFGSTVTIPGHSMDVRVVLTLDGGETKQAERTTCLVPVQFTPSLRGGTAAGLQIFDSSMGMQTIDLGIAGTFDITYDMAGNPTLTMAESQPIVIRATSEHPTEGDLSSAIQWSSDTGFGYLGPLADLSQLPAATHVFDVSVSDSMGIIDTQTLTVVVNPFFFTATICSPRPSTPDPCDPSGMDPQSMLDEPPYYQGQPVPLRVKIDHAFQPFFPNLSVQWSSPELGNLTTGLQTQTFAQLPSAGIMRVTVRDEQGRSAFADSDYVLQQLNLVVDFQSPSVGTSILENETIDVQMNIQHTLVTAGILNWSDLSVRYFSDIQGLLVDTMGNDIFVGDDGDPMGMPPVPGFMPGATFGNLIPGTHNITARVRDGTAIVETSRVVEVRSFGVNAVLLQPSSTNFILFPGQPLDLDVLVTHDPAVMPEYAWYIDGVEFDPSWGMPAYGMDPLAASRSTISLGNYDDMMAPYNDAAWAEGVHTIRFQTKLPTVTGTGCLNIQDRASCFEITVDVAPNSTTEVAQTITTNEFWSGVVRVTGEIIIDLGGSLTIQPGTKVIMDPGVRFQIIEGTLNIGSNGSALRTFLMAQGANATVGSWSGIWVNAGGSGQQVDINVENTTVRHATTFLWETNSSSYFGDGGDTLHIDNLLVEDVNRAWYRLCPDTVNDVTIRNAVTIGFDEVGANNCDLVRTYDNITVENSQVGAAPTAFSGFASQVTFNNLVMRNIVEHGISGNALGQVGSSVTINGAEFDDVGTLSDSWAPIQVDECTVLTVDTTQFRNSYNGIRRDNNCGTNLLSLQSLTTVTRSVFDGLTRAVYYGAAMRSPSNYYGNSFTNIGTYFQINGGNANGDQLMHGNFMGGTLATPGGVALSAAAGVTPTNLPGIWDYADNNNIDSLVRVYNPLAGAFASPGAAPLGVIEEPKKPLRYHTNNDGCVRMKALSPGGVVDPVNDCRFGYYDVATETVADAVWMDQLGDIDAFGCVNTVAHPLAEGEYGLVLECDNGIGRVDQVTSTFLVDNTNYIGDIHRPNENWTEDATVIGDIIVPFGKNLTISAGTTVTFNTGDNLKHTKTMIDTAAINTDIGRRDRIEIFTHGSLDIVGTAMSKVTLRQAASMPTVSDWAGIRATRGASVTLSHVDITGAGTFLWSEYHGVDWASEAVINLDNLTFDNSWAVARGVCPRTFDTITGTNMGRIINIAYCSQPEFIINDGSFVGLSYTSSLGVIALESYPNNTGNVQLTIERTVVDRATGTRQGRAIRIDRSDSRIRQWVINDSTFRDFEYIFSQDGFSNAPYTLTVQNGTYENFRYLTDDTNWRQVTMDFLTISSGQYIYRAWNTNIDRFMLTNSRITDVTDPFFTVEMGNDMESNNFVVTGNEFDTVANRIFDMYVTSFPNVATYNVDFSGNNFVNVNEVFITSDPDLTNMSYTIEMNTDLTGCWWDTTNTTTIESMLADPQVDLGADAVGRIDYSGYLMSKPTLSIP